MNARGEVELACSDFNAELENLQRDGWRLDVIYPADDPHTASLMRRESVLRLTSRPGSPPPPDELPPFEPGFVLTKGGGGSGEGRAGMLYRDLIPGRLGGRYIASHVTIPGGGPVADWVHYHRVAFQMIFVRSGWVRVVYEDQGEPFVMHAGDAVLQPPLIRHRVLESSPGLEVIEIGAPALHATFADHDMALPTGCDPSRRWSGQGFLHHVAADAPWRTFFVGQAQETAMLEATCGIADVRTVRPHGSGALHFPPHEGELVLGFVLQGSGRLDYADGFDLEPGDAFVIPPMERWGVCGPSTDFRLLHVTTGRLDPKSA